MQTSCKSWLSWGTRVAGRLVLVGLVMTATTCLNSVNAKEQVQRKSIHNAHKSEKKTRLIVKNHKHSKSILSVKKADTVAHTTKHSKAKKNLPNLKTKTSVKANNVKMPQRTLRHKMAKTLKTSQALPKLTKSAVRHSHKNVQVVEVSQQYETVKASTLALTHKQTKHGLTQSSKRAKQHTQTLKQAKLPERQKKSASQMPRLHKATSVAMRETRVDSKPKVEEKREAGRVLQVGTASYYGPQFNGGRTASGERFNQNDLTCAHNGLPFGCKIRVTNLRNNKSVDVRVNDRGGFAKHGRVIDLSKAAAGKIGMLGSGTAKVKIQVVH